VTAQSSLSQRVQTDVYAVDEVRFSALNPYFLAVVQSRLQTFFESAALPVRPSPSSLPFEGSVREENKPGSCKRAGVFPSKRWSQQDPLCIRWNTLVKNVIVSQQNGRVLLNFRLSLCHSERNPQVCSWRSTKQALLPFQHYICLSRHKNREYE